MLYIVSDSTCDLTKELIERYQVHIIPLHVVLGEQEYLDGVNIQPDEIYRWSDAHKTTPKTSAPSFEDVREVFESLLKEPEDEILAFSISASMSASGQVMKLAAEQMEVEERVHVVDSENLSTGIGLLVVEAAILAQEGKTVSEILEVIYELRPKVRASFVVDTLTYLHRGGRCSSVAAFAGAALKLHPRIEVTGGAMQAGKKYRGKYENIVLKYAQDMEASMKQARPNRVFITHSGIDEAVIQSVKEYLAGLNVFEEILVTRAGGVISSHCGYGTLGVLYIGS